MDMAHHLADSICFDRWHSWIIVCDVVVDFTVAASSVETLKICADNKTAVVLGTTGFDADQNRFLDQVGSKIALMAAPNMSIGVNLVFKLLEMAAKAMGNEADVEIIEAHHHHKVDSPSGTALRMGEIVANTLGRDLEKHALYGRQGQIGARDPETIGFSTIRAGDIVGEHTVLFASTGERVEITHRASNRMNFAQGAMRAVKWIMNQPPGRYDMHDVLGLRND